MDLRILKNIKQNLERLRRQYQINVENYDEPGMLDLSHVLRIWVDMQEDVQTYLNEINPSARFQTYNFTKDFKKLIWGKEYVISGIPGGVISNAGRIGDDFQLFGIKNDDINRPLLTSWKNQFLENSEINMGDIYFIYHYFAEDEVNIICKGIFYKKVKFSEWMKAEAIKVSYPDEGKLEVRSISREMFIKRVANILGGSHPEGNYETDKYFDTAVRYLMNYYIAGLPVPFFILLKIAKDILDNVK